LVLEAAILNVRPGQSDAFETALHAARPLFAATPGFRKLEIRPCLEKEGQYLLLVWWDRLEDHTIGFRGSDRYKAWREALHHFYDPFPPVWHFSDPISDAEPGPTPPGTL
jgi:heme-degrading monooxygenase HmoA